MEKIENETANATKAGKIQNNRKRGGKKMKKTNKERWIMEKRRIQMQREDTILYIIDI